MRAVLFTLALCCCFHPQSQIERWLAAGGCASLALVADQLLPRRIPR